VPIDELDGIAGRLVASATAQGGSWNDVRKLLGIKPQWPRRRKRNVSSG